MLQNPNYQKRSLYFNASYLFRGKQKLSLFVHRASNTGDTGRINRDFDHQYDTINLAYANQINNRLNVQLKAGYRDYDRYWSDDNFPASLALKNHSGVRQKILPFDFSINYKHSGESLLTFGVDRQFTNYKTYTVTNSIKTINTNAFSTSRGIFMQEKLVRDKWIFRAGGRLNQIDHSYDIVNDAAPAGDTKKSWSKPLWSFGTRYNKSSKISFYANTGTSFLVPSAKQIWGTPDGQIKNPDIKEENGTGSDFGIEWRPDSKLTIGIRTFFNKLDNAIIDNVVSLNPSRTQSVNSGKARSYGAELMAEQKTSDKLSWFANLTRISSKVENPLDNDNDGTSIPFVPDYVANAGLTMKLTGEVTLSPYIQMTGNYYDSTSNKSRNKFGSCQTINLKIQKKFPEKSKYNASVFADLNNITNKRYEMPWQFQDTGFNALIGLEVNF